MLPNQVAELAQVKQRWFETQGVRYALVLRAIVRDIDSQARSQELRFDFTGKRALPGSPGRLKWQAAYSMLPAEYLLHRGNSMGVFVLENGLARFVKLEVAEEGQAAAIDLPAQTRIIIDGRFGLKNGDRVIDVEQKQNP